jgi:helix-loop-helix DNA-binding protein
MTQSTPIATTTHYPSNGPSTSLSFENVIAHQNNGHTDKHHKRSQQQVQDQPTPRLYHHDPPRTLNVARRRSSSSVTDRQTGGATPHATHPLVVALQTAPSPPSPPSPPSTIAPLLRTVSRTRKPRVSSDSAPATSLQRSRDIRNKVEKKYRTRLNEQFARLLETLPVPTNDENDENDEDDILDPPIHQSRWLSKYEVLGLARQHIRKLEKSKSAIYEETRRLEDQLEKMGVSISRVGAGGGQKRRAI